MKPESPKAKAAFREDRSNAFGADRARDFLFRRDRIQLEFRGNATVYLIFFHRPYLYCSTSTALIGQ
jgi:hypothetical protein